MWRRNLTTRTVDCPARHDAVVAVTFRVETMLAAAPERVFDLCRDIEVHMAGFAHTRERAVAGVISGLIGPGEEVTWSARHFGLPFRLTSRIVEYDRPRLFVDEQVQGPFKRYRHMHRFDAVPTGTRVTDDVEFTAPAGPLGWLVERAMLAAYMKRLIETRSAHIKTLAERAT